MLMMYPPHRLKGHPFELEWDPLPNYTIRSSNSFECRKIIFEMITSMGIRHAKVCTLRGRSSTKLGQRHIRNEDLRTELEYSSEDYDKEREMEPRPEHGREATLTLRPRAHVVRRQQERIVGFVEAPNREGSRRGRNAKGPDWLSLYWGNLRLSSTRGGLHEEQRISGFVHGLRTRSLIEHLSTDLPTTYKGLMEKTYTWIKAREVATNGTPNAQRENFKRSRKSYRDDNHGQKDRDRFSSYRGPHHGLLSTLSKSPREILTTKKAARSFKEPPRMFGSRWSRDKTKYYQFHKDHGHDTNQCQELKHQVEEVVKSRQLVHLVKEVKKKEKISNTQLDKWKKGEKYATPIEAPVLMIRRESYNPRKRPAERNKISRTDNRHRNATANKNQNKVTRPPEDVRQRLRMTTAHMTGVPRTVTIGGETFQHRVQSKRAQTLRTSEEQEEKLVARKKRSDLHPSGGAYKGQNFMRSQVLDVGDIVIKSDVEEEMLADIKETLDGLRAINLKLNPKKSSFGVEEGIFTGHLIIKQVIKASPSKVKAISDMQPPKSTAIADEAFRRMKELLEALPTVTAPIKGETLIMYLAALEESISAILMAERGKKQIPVYFVSRTLQGAELGYPELEKLILALVYTARRLQRYFQAHPIEVLRKNSVKGQILADFQAETPLKEEEGPKDKEAKRKGPEPEKAWKLFTDGASSSDGSGAGLILVIPKQKEYTNALKLEFKTTNNEAGYEALLAVLRLAKEIRVQELTIFVDSQLVANQVNGLFEARQTVIKQYLEKAKELLPNFPYHSIEHIKRDQNKKEDALRDVIHNVGIAYLTMGNKHRGTIANSTGRRKVVRISYNGQAVFTMNEFLHLLHSSKRPKDLIIPIFLLPMKFVDFSNWNHYPHLENGIYNVVDRVMRPLALQQTRKSQSDRGMPKARQSVSSASAHHFGSSSHYESDEEDEGISQARTPSQLLTSTLFNH
uniref:RNase H type-1 domain-containing protein n=1 Tax=Tanacetum cinerariifolium TaxID=118510 RepID=A0A6L2KIB6_TANCI|nr:hypothetical protein [Tanacetum cinerariifolium]